MKSVHPALSAILVVTCAWLSASAMRAHQAVPVDGTTSTSSPRAPQSSPEPGARFRSGVELVHVTATVVDGGSRFVRGLEASDFLVYEDDRPQAVTTFSNERAPVSLGIAIDTSSNRWTSTS